MLFTQELAPSEVETGIIELIEDRIQSIEGIKKSMPTLQRILEQLLLKWNVATTKKI